MRSNDMRSSEALIGWNVRGNTEGVPMTAKNEERMADQYQCVAGATPLFKRRPKRKTRQSFVLKRFHEVVVRDEVDYKKAHNAFLAIDEYRAAISPEVRSARE
jgi:hypothetical protein